MGLRLFVPLFVLVLVPAVARAVPTVDNNTGTFFDDYSDGTGLITTAPASVSTVRDPLAGAMTLSGTWTPPPACCADTSCTGGEDCVPPPALTGHFSTVDIIPSSFNAWTSIAIEHRELVTGQVEVFFDAITPTGTIVPFGPLTRIPAPPAESPFTLRFSLDGVDAALYPRGRVRVAMTAATAIKPTISALRVQWRAIPRVKVVLEAPSTVCSNATLTLRNQVSVSYTDATHFLVTMARPDGALPNPPHPEVQPGPFAQNDLTAFANATEGGLFHPGPGNLVLGPNAVVPPGHVYWYRPTQPAGTSFILSASFAVPQGLLNQTAFSVQSHASAGNLTAPGGAAIAVPSNTAQITVGPTAPSPVVSRSLGNIYRIDGVDYSYPDRDISVSLSGYNYNHPQYACGETYYQAWVWDDLAPIMNKIQKPGGTLASGVFDISHSGQVSGPGGTTTWDGFTIPPNVVYWDLRDLTVGEWFSLGYKVRLDKYVADGGTLVRDEVLTQCSTLRSDFRSSQSSGCRSLTIGVPDSPRGVFALGDRIRTSLSVNASFQDNNTSALQYGERYSLAMYAVNRGASALNNVVMFNKLPAQVTLDSVYVPPSANAVVRYYIGTNFNDPATPPPLDVDGNPPAADAALWLATPPANKKSVTWIYVQVPALSSTFFPNLVTAPNSVTAEVYVTVDQPSGACSEFLIHDLMVGRVYGYISPDMVVASPILGGQPRILPAGVTYTPGSTTDPEWAEVRPRTPRANLALSVSPTNLVGSGGTLNVNATLWNAQPGGSATGPMLDPKVVITVPSLAVNGGPAAPLAFGGVMNAPGASVDYSQLQTTGQLTFTYPTLDAFASRSISFNLVVPKGFVSGTTLAASGVATGRDASCGPTNASTGASAVIRGEPSLYLTKTVDFGVAGPGSALKYELSIANLGQAVATGAWVVDRLPDAVTLSSIKRPSWATSVWFSNAPSLPELISNDFTFNGPLIQANFVEGTYGAPDAQGNRTVSWPAGMTPRWIAWNVSDPTLSPSLLVTDTVRRLSFDVTVNPGVPENTVANNDVLAFADGLLQTIGLRAVTIISPDPSLRLAVQCGPDVLAGGEEGTLVLPYYNDSANEDESVTIEVDLAGHDYLGYTHTWNAVSQQLRGTPPITVTALGDGRYLFTIITTNDPPLDSLEGGTLEVRYAPPLASTSGDILPVTVLGLATNTDGDFSAFGRCQTLVSNPDIQVRKQIDQADPPSGQRVTFTLFLKNAGAHWAPSVVLTDVIPADFVYVANSAAILSPGWTGAPSFANDTLTWSTLRKTGVTPPVGVPQNGFLPGNTEVILTFKADVAQVGPDHPLENCARATTTLAEDDPDPVPPGEDDNEGCATARTPLPDPTVTKTGPSTALPGERVTWTLTYRNLSRESAIGTYLIDRLPYVPSDAYPTAAAVRYAAHHASHGEVAWFHAAPRNGPQPAFNPSSPGTTGWQSTPTSPVNWVAFVVPSPLPALSSPRQIQIDADLFHPVGQQLPEPGTRFENCVTVAMGGVGAVNDGNPNNNTACATVGTPGIDLALSATCTPGGAELGVRPGDSAEYSLTVRNAGTTIAYGIRVTPSPGARLLEPSLASPVALALDASGQPIALRDEAGDARTSAVEWTAAGADWLLGTAQPGSANHHRTVGLPPGASVTLTFTGTVSLEALSEELIVHAGLVTPEYGLGFIPGVSETEDNTSNNAASCDVTAYRPDLLITKDVELLRDYPAGGLASGVANVGDTLRYTLVVSNLGRAAASNPRIQDFFPAGTRFVPGSLTGDLGGAIVEYADADFNWSASASANAIGLRLVFPGTLEVGGSGLFELDTAAELGGDGHNLVNASIDPIEGLVVPDAGDTDTLGCSSNDSYTLPANRTYTHTASYMNSWNFWPFNEHVYTYAAPYTGCCLDQPSHAYDVCTAMTQNDLLDWSDGIDWCDEQYSYDLDSWLGCLCSEEAREVEMQCEAECQADWDQCLMDASDACFVDYSNAEVDWLDLRPEEYCFDGLYWIEQPNTGAIIRDEYRLTLQANCQSDFETDRDDGVDDCENADLASFCLEYPPYWVDGCGNQQDPDATQVLQQCGDDFNVAIAQWADSEPYNGCYGDGLPFWTDISGMQTSWYADNCSEWQDCEPGGTGPCAHVGSNFEMECNSDPGIYASGLATEWEGSCGGQPAYPCFDTYGPPPEDRCNTNAYCNGKAPATGTASYTSPLGPSDDGSVRVQSWLSLTVGHNFAPGELRVDLVDADGQPIAGFEDLPLDADGQTSLASLPTSVRELAVKTTFTSAADGCFEVGPLLDVSNTRQAMNNMDTWLPNDFPPLTFADGRMTRVQYLAGGPDLYPLSIETYDAQLVSSAIGEGYSAFQVPENYYDSAEPWFDTASDGSIAGPHAIWSGDTYNVQLVATGLLVGSDFEVLPAEDFDPTWGANLYDEWWMNDGGTGFSNDPGRLVASKDLVVGQVLSADQASWEQCNADLEAACQDELAQAVAYHEKVQQCALWLGCLYDALSDCEGNADPDGDGCGVVTDYTGFCGDLDHEDGCVTDEWSDEWSDYDSERLSPFMAPYAQDCEAATQYGERGWNGPGPYEGYVFEDFYGFYGGGNSDGGGYDFASCDDQAYPYLRLAVFTRSGEGWSVELLPDAPALGIYTFATSSQLIDVSADGSLILAQYGLQLAVWRRGPSGQYQAERVATLDVGHSPEGTIGGLSDDGTFVWWSYRWLNGRNRVATYNAGTWTAQVLAADGAIQGGDANGRVFFGYAGAQRRRWVPSPTGYTSQTFSTAGLMPALIGGAATLVGIGPDGTVVGHYEYSDDRFPEYGSFPSRAGLVWPPEGPPIGLTLEPGYELMAAHVTADRRVFGYYAPDNVDYNLMLSPMPAYGAFEYRCSATSRPSLDKLTLTYDAADSAELSFDVEVADLCQTEVTNVASVENDVPEITLTNNTDDASSGINAVSLEASVTASKVAVSLNDTIVYTYTVKNTGPGRAQGVAVTGALSPYVTIEGGTVARTIAELAPNETQTWQVTTRVNTNLPNLPLTATVGASTDTIACDTTRETASATSLTGSWPNIAVTKTGPASATVSSGATPTEITYTLNVASNGNDISRNVVLTDTLPNDVTFVSSNPPASVSGQVLTWTLGDMAAGTNLPVTVTVRLPSCAAVGTTLVNTASATTTSLEADTSDNSASTSTSLTGPLGRLRADVSLDRPTLMSGERLWYTVRYWNQGAAPVTGATLTVPLPANATFVPGSAAAGLTPVNDALTWNLGTVGLGASGSVGFAVIATGGPITASPVTVDGGGTCPFTATVPAPTTTTGGLVISKAANTHSACASEQPTLTWSLTVINRGATPLTGVVVTDTIPAGTSYVGGSITGLGANAAGAPTLSWNIGALAPGRGVTLTYHTSTPTGALTLVSNTASAAATGVAAVTSNTATVLADCAAPLALDKSWSGTCSLQGEAFAVTLRARNRTGLPRTVTLSDSLPPTLEVVDRGGASGTGNDLEFTGVVIPAASTVTRTFTVKVAAGVPDGTPVTNQAHLAGGGLVATSNPVTSVPITCPGAAEPECQTVACSMDGLCVYPSTNEGQTCSDDSLCTVNDRCELGACVGQAAQCDDDNTCTADSCVPATGCVNDATSRDGASCIDGDACTTGDTCQAGDCVPGPPRDCDDGNPCTNDSCDPAIGCVNTPNTASCDDGNACTTNDTCSAGSCAGGPPLACNDDQPCTDDSCNPATGCVFVADNTNTCNDGRFCTTQDRCDAGLCVGNLRTCNDNEGCTADRCDDMLAACVFDASLLEGTSCDDGSACTTNDVCSAGDCGGTELTCGQGECAGTCDPETGCEYSATNGVSCDDGDVCTQNETCSQGLCGGAEPVTCNDNNDCTLDTCDPVMGCIFDPEAKQGQQCDADSDLCTQNDSCQSGTCTAGAPVDCSGDMGCEGTCDSMTGACDYPTGTCDDGDACTSGESCDLGACANGTALECDDNDPCTDDRCDPMSGCVFELNTGNTCDDEDLCTTGDTCQSGVCVGDAVTCEAMDSDCQLGSMCDPGTGQCTWSTAPCDDDDLCTMGEVCGELGVCSGGEAVTCDDGELCTDDYCDPTQGCVFDGGAMEGEECDADQSACTPADTCQSGECVADLALTCEGDGGCAGTCDDATGLCLFAAEACDDGNACTTGETCAPDGACSGSEPVICPSGDGECQLASCDPESGCRLDMLSGIPCDDGDACTDGDQCDEGACAAGPDVECDDNDACTSDACVDGECVFTRTGTGGLDDNCDGIDDDCDGQTDEDYQREITCGVGECAGMTGLEICVEGQPLAQCDAFFGAIAELCDGLDNDCDGDIDEGYMDGDCGEETVVYLIVNDSDGVPIGTARCFQAANGGAIRCDTDTQDPTGRKLRVYDALLCPVE